MLRSKRTATVLAALVLIFYSGIAFAAPRDSSIVHSKDSWWGNDKVTHTVIGFTLAGFASGISITILDNTREASVMIGVSIPVGLSLAKEWYDLKHPKRHRASLKDIVAGCVGAAIGTAFIISLSP